MKPVITVQFYETYYFANAVRSILLDQFSYLRNLDDFYGDDKYLAFTRPFARFSAFHCFLEFVIDELLTNSTETVDLEERFALYERFKSIPSAIADMRPKELPIEAALRAHGYMAESFEAWLEDHGTSFAEATQDDIYEYLGDLRLNGPYDDLLLHSIREVFFLLFRDRHVLLLFNDMIASVIKDTSIEETSVEYVAHFAKSGILKRVHIPDWVRRSVFFRDRGACVLCNADLSGLLNIWSENHFDHMVPLAAGGLNDVTNIQLLCAHCNLKKGSKQTSTSSSYEDWYPLESDGFSTG